MVDLDGNSFVVGRIVDRPQAQYFFATKSIFMATTLHTGRSHTGIAQWQWVILLVVLAYEALGCLAGGSMLTAVPDGSIMKMPVSLLHGVFPDFRIPGIILFALGILNTIAFFAVLRRRPSSWVWATLAMGRLLIWFWVEIMVVVEYHWLHAMWGLPVVVGALAALPLIPGNVRKGLLVSGILSSLVYIVADIVAAAQWAGYSFADQAFSELTAAEAPSRYLLVYVSAIPHNLLVIAFAAGVWMMASRYEQKRRMKLISLLLMVHVVSGFLGGTIFPMHSRGITGAGPDDQHLVFTAIEVAALLGVLVLAVGLPGKGFRIYTIVTIGLLLAGGGIAALYGPKVAADMATPGLGLIERVNIYGFMVWVMVFAGVLLKRIQHPLRN